MRRLGPRPLTQLRDGVAEPRLQARPGWRVLGHL